MNVGNIPDIPKIDKYHEWRILITMEMPRSCVTCFDHHFNSLRQSDALPLVQIMVCCLVGTKPLSDPMVGYCHSDPWKINCSEILIKIDIFSFKKMHSKCRLQNVNFVLASLIWWYSYASAFRRRRHYVFGLSVRPSIRPSVRPSVRSLKYPLLTCT